MFEGTRLLANPRGPLTGSSLVRHVPDTALQTGLNRKLPGRARILATWSRRPWLSPPLRIRSPVAPYPPPFRRQVGRASGRRGSERLQSAWEGRLAQRESTVFTRQGSLVQIQHRPPDSLEVSTYPRASHRTGIRDASQIPVEARQQSESGTGMVRPARWPRTAGAGIAGAAFSLTPGASLRPAAGSRARHPGACPPRARARSPGRARGADGGHRARRAGEGKPSVSRPRPRHR